jgi:hypothetical protein
LRPENRKAVIEIAGREGIHLSEWFPEEHEIGMTTSSKTNILPALG